MLKLRCRNCNDTIESDKKDSINFCGCRKCSIQFKDGMFYIGSETGIGGYVLIDDNNKEYIMVDKEEYLNV